MLAIANILVFVFHTVDPVQRFRVDGAEVAKMESADTGSDNLQLGRDGVLERDGLLHLHGYPLASARGNGDSRDRRQLPSPPCKKPNRLEPAGGVGEQCCPGCVGD